MNERVIQFGGGAFLRGFVDHFINSMNSQGLFNGSVVIVQSVMQSSANLLASQNGRYNLYLRGIDHGIEINQRNEISCISRCINATSNFDDVLLLAQNPDFRFIISNTTESGIEYLGTENYTDSPPKSFPAKLTRLLYQRFQCNLPGFIILPCELIDNNADILKSYIIKYANLWNLPPSFTTWLQTQNHFCNTLVDRIVTGFPHDEAPKLCADIGYDDKLLNTAEPFHLWVIQGHHESEFPLQSAGFNAVWCDDVSPYKTRKVRILNGAHTATIPAAILYGLSTVGETLSNSLTNAFLQKCLFNEIVPTLGNTHDNINFANSVLERFANPYIKHLLSSIALNSISKFKIRVLPSILKYKAQTSFYPPALSLSLAALITLYKSSTPPNDSPNDIVYMQTNNIHDILSNTNFWDCDLTDMQNLIQQYYEIISLHGINEAYMCLS